jgi:hypothetical protein
MSRQQPHQSGLTPAVLKYIKTYLKNDETAAKINKMKEMYLEVENNSKHSLDQPDSIKRI